MALELTEEVLLSHFDFSESFSFVQHLNKQEPKQPNIPNSPLHPSTTQRVPSQMVNEAGDEILTPTQLVHKEDNEERAVVLLKEEEVLTPTQRVHHDEEEVLTPTQRVYKEEEKGLTPTKRVNPQHINESFGSGYNSSYFESPMKRLIKHDDSGIVRRSEDSVKNKIDAIDPSVYSILVSQSFLQNRRERGKHSSSDFDFKATFFPKAIPGWYHKKKTSRNQTLLCTSAKEKLRPPQCQFHSPSNHSIFFSHRWLPDDRNSFESDLVAKLEKDTQQRIFYDKTCLRTGHIINRFLGSLYDCKVILLYINDWTMKVMKDKLFKGEEDYVFLEWQLACLHTLRGGTVIPVLEGVTLADLRTLPMTSYPAITLEEFEDTSYSHIGDMLSSCVAITISANDPSTVQPLCDAILKATVSTKAPTDPQPSVPAAPLRTAPCPIIPPTPPTLTAFTAQSVPTPHKLTTSLFSSPPYPSSLPSPSFFASKIEATQPPQTKPTFKYVELVAQPAARSALPTLQSALRPTSPHPPQLNSLPPLRPTSPHPPQLNHHPLPQHTSHPTPSIPASYFPIQKAYQQPAQPPPPHDGQVQATTPPTPPPPLPPNQQAPNSSVQAQQTTPSPALPLLSASNQQVRLGYQSARGIYSLRDYILPSSPQHSTTPPPTPHFPHLPHDHRPSSSSTVPAPTLQITSVSPLQTVILHPYPPCTSLILPTAFHNLDTTLPTFSTSPTPPTSPSLSVSPSQVPQEAWVQDSDQHLPLMYPQSSSEARAVDPPQSNAPLEHHHQPLTRKRALHDSHDFGGWENLSRFKTLRISHH